jgi:MFS family permease
LAARLSGTWETRGKTLHCLLMTSLGFAGSQRAELSGRAAIVAVAAMIAVLFAGSTVLTPLYVIYKQQFGFSQIVLTLIYAAYVVGNLAALLLFGRVSDEIGRRRTVVPAMAVAILSALVFLFAEGTVALYIGRILSGFGIGVGAGTGTAWLAELIGDEDKSRASTIATGANFVGLAFGALMTGSLHNMRLGPCAFHSSYICSRCSQSSHSCGTRAKRFPGRSAALRMYRCGPAFRCRMTFARNLWLRR